MEYKVYEAKQLKQVNIKYITFPEFKICKSPKYINVKIKKKYYTNIIT